MSAAPENILVVPRPLLEKLGIFQGLNFEVDRYMPSLLDPENNFFMSRPDAENDPSFKQLIPYLVIRHQDRILHYTRGKSGGEARLHAKGSIGIGGHINDGDTRAAHFDATAYHRAIERELHEELVISSPYKQTIAALLNDDTSDVGRVHLGVVHIVTVESPDIRPHEDAIRDLHFYTIAELLARREHLEAWSQIIIDEIQHLPAFD